MKNIFYVAENLMNAITFIRSNTDWKQVTNVSFRNGDENITVISDFTRIIGKKVEGIYIDYSFARMNNYTYTDFVQRFKALGMEPVVIEEKEI